MEVSQADRPRMHSPWWMILKQPGTTIKWWQCWHMILSLLFNTIPPLNLIQTKPMLHVPFPTIKTIYSFLQNRKATIYIYIHGKQASHSICHKIFTLHHTSSLTHIFGPSFSLMVVSFHLIKKSCSLKFTHQTTIDHYQQYDSVDCHHGMLPLNPLI